MTAALISIAAMALVVAAVYAVLSGSLSRPLGSVRAGTRRTPRPSPQPTPSPRRDGLPLTAEQLAELLLTRPWESHADTPELAVMSAHENHDYYPGCPICAGDEEGLTRIADVVLRALLGEMAAEDARREGARKAAQLPIVGVDSAVRDYHRQMTCLESPTPSSPLSMARGGEVPPPGPTRDGGAGPGGVPHVPS